MNSIRQCRPLLGTYVEIYIAADEDDDALLDRSCAAFDEIERIQKLMSFHDPDSELTRINQTAHLREMEISRDLWHVLSFVQDLNQKSDGFFDPTIAPALIRQGLLPHHGNLPETPSNWNSIMLTASTIRFAKPTQLDLGGIAKGYAVDRALLILGDADATVNAGGDLAMRHWRDRHVEIRTPGSQGRETIRVPMENATLATSAGYYLKPEQHVIINPYTHLPIPSRQSVSVFANSCMIADALTKAALLMPDSSKVMGAYGASGFVIELDGVVVRI